MSSMKDNTKSLLAARRSLELSLLSEIQDWEQATGLCVSGVALTTCDELASSTTLDRTVDVRVEVLL